MTLRKRLDHCIVERGIVSSREEGRRHILAGHVLVNGISYTKAGSLIATDADIVLLEESRYVSRGGEKLEGVLDTFSVDVTALSCVDIGISTGGFTDCLLQRGAASVFGIDVGYGQVAWRIRQDPRVSLLERTNIRYLDAGTLGRTFDLAVIDVSFISLARILPVADQLIRDGGTIISLVKPQFEVGKGRVGKGGIVKDPLLHREVLTKLSELITSLGHEIIGECPSPIQGAKGNQEYFIVSLKRVKRGNNVQDNRNNCEDSA